MAVLPPLSALKHLEPRPGGRWTVTDQGGDSFCLSYMMDGGAEASTYTLHQCATEEDIRKHCSSFVFEYTNMQHANETIGHQIQEEPQRHRTSFVRLELQTRDGVPALQDPVLQSTAPNLGLYSFEAETPIAPQLLGRAQENFQFGTQIVSQHLNQFDNTLPINDGLQILPGGLNSGPINWPLESNYMSATNGNTHMPPVGGLVGNRNATSQDSNTNNNLLQPTSWQDNWPSMGGSSGYLFGDGWGSAVSDK